MSVDARQPGMLAQFDRTISIWGPVTLFLGFLVSLFAALFAAFGLGLGLTAGEVWKAVSVVLGTFGIIAIVEPISYYPILGRAATYQAFMIGNISNKLLPAAIIAQSNLDEKPGTRRGEFIACAAIIGAVLVHLTTLILFVGIGGSMLIDVLPESLIDVARRYILPAVFGAVLVQVVVAMKAPRTTMIAIVVACLVNFLLIPYVGALANYGTPIAVIITILGAWYGRDQTTKPAASTTSQGEPE
ncbi:MAG: hypothetical protein V9G19_07630 [Tetrasphaera sp.]